MISPRLTFYFITVLLTTSLAACSKSSNSSPSNRTVGPPASSGVTTDGEDDKPQLTRGGVEPAKDDTLMLFYGDDPATLNLITASDSTASALQRPVYEYLARRCYDDPLEWEPQLAETWEFDEEKLEFTIHLRKGVQWHPMRLPNGTKLPSKEFTARDVKFTFDCVLNEYVEAAQKRSYYLDPSAEDPAERIKIRVSMVDKYTIKVKWTKPYFQADDYTLMVQIMPRHVYSVDENGEPFSFDFSSKEFADGFNSHWANTKMCGTGPLIFSEYVKSDRVVYERNPDYWGDPYFFSSVVRRYISNNNTSRQQLLTKELDFGSIPQIDLYFQSKDHPNVKAKEVELIEFPQTGYRYVGYNLQRKIFQDKRVRIALGHAVPVDDIIDKIYHGLAVRMTGPFLPRGAFSAKDIEPIPFDLEVAKQLLETAGWKDTNGNGIRDKEIDGEVVEFKFDTMIFSESPQYLSIAELIKENCQQIGVEMQISPTKWALFLEKLNKKEFDSMILGWASDWKSDPFQLWHSSQADQLSSSNFGYKNSEVDVLIEELRMTLDEERQIEIYHQLHRLIYDDQPYTFLYSELATAAKDARIQNVNFYPDFRPHVDSREWHTTYARVIGK